MVVKEMAITHADFFRIIPRVLRDAPHERDALGVSLDCGPGRLRISLAPEGRRTLGTVALPLTRVELRFTGCTQSRVNAFLADFDTRFRRGGG